MINKLIKLYKANVELKKHKEEIDKYNRTWAKINKEKNKQGGSNDK